MESGRPSDYRRPAAEARGFRGSPGFRRDARQQRWLSEYRNLVDSHRGVQASPRDNGRAVDFQVSSLIGEAAEQATRLDRRSTRVPREQTLTLPVPEKSDRANRDRTRLLKRPPALSVRPRWFLTLRRLPPNPQVGALRPPGQRGQQTASENDWPARPGRFQPDFLRHELRFPDGVPRERRMEEVRWLLRGRSLPPKNGAHA